MAKRRIMNKIEVKSVKCEVCGALHELSSKNYIKTIGFIGIGNYEKSLSEIPARICCTGTTCFGALSIKMIDETNAENAPKPKRNRKKAVQVEPVEVAVQDEQASN